MNELKLISLEQREFLSYQCWYYKYGDYGFTEQRYDNDIVCHKPETRYCSYFLGKIGKNRPKYKNSFLLNHPAKEEEYYISFNTIEEMLEFLDTL